MKKICNNSREDLNSYYTQVQRIFNEAFVAASVCATEHFMIEPEIEVYAMRGLGNVPGVGIAFSASAGVTHSVQKNKKIGRYKYFSNIIKDGNLTSAYLFSAKFARELTIANKDEIIKKSEQKGYNSFSESVSASVKDLANIVKDGANAISGTISQGLLGEKTSRMDDMAIEDAKNARNYVWEGTLEKDLGQEKFKNQDEIVSKLLDVVLGQYFVKSDSDISKEEQLPLLGEKESVLEENEDLHLVSSVNELSQHEGIQAVLGPEFVASILKRREVVDEQIEANESQKEQIEISPIDKIISLFSRFTGAETDFFVAYIKKTFEEQKSKYSNEDGTFLTSSEEIRKFRLDLLSEIMTRSSNNELNASLTPEDSLTTPSTRLESISSSESLIKIANLEKQNAELRDEFENFKEEAAERDKNLRTMVDKLMADTEKRDKEGKYR